MTLRLVSVSKSFAGRAVLSDVSLAVEAGESVRLTGPSGIGKSTLLGIAAGLAAPDSGRIERPARLAMAFQQDALLPWADAFSNLTYALAALPDAKGRARTWLDAFDLAADLTPEKMSGGMRRRLSLARAFAAGAPLLLLDEPFAFLDAPWRRRIARSIDEAAARGTAVLYATHQAEETPESTRRTLTLAEGGRLIALG